ncbi:hypothetical protein GCM10022419_079940 [Nonomuraea rosea]|uniref:Histidine kinase/HSP90-like ATPase domain-containing protein n=1 Tax=Nonomuraea rosea TaxID=638574 RepID=A0ABP6YLQ4_9ACTN
MTLKADLGVKVKARLHPPVSRPRRDEWSGAEVARVVPRPLGEGLGGPPGELLDDEGGLGGGLTVVAARAREMSDADLVQVLLPDPTGQTLIVEVAEGEGSDELLGAALYVPATPAGLVPEPVIEHVLAVLREALSNVVRHSHATRAEVSVVVTAGSFALVVTDDGVGPGESGRRSGLRNIEERAARLGGTTPGGVARWGRDAAALVRPPATYGRASFPGQAAGRSRPERSSASGIYRQRTCARRAGHPAATSGG